MTDAPPADGPDPRELTARLERLVREHERLFGELSAAEQRYRRLARAVWQVEEAERRRLSREVHDGLGQTLTALKHLLSRLFTRSCEADSPLAPDLNDALEIVTAALADARELSRLLRPPMLDDLGLVPALRWLTRSLRENAGLDVDLVLRGEAVEEEDGDAERVEPDLETVVFRAVQEALTNVLKHSASQRAVVELEVGPRQVLLTVADSGTGFDPDATLAASTQGVGLRGLRDRVQLFGGTCRVVSAPGAGTRVELVLPRSSPD
ncbi:MAG TPA: sensor histidine kinase [Thermoanaerobaculia bacterium]|nr:sensor histidine kinase [Thermoanaerobaculia bacterium]